MTDGQQQLLDRLEIEALVSRLGSHLDERTFDGLRDLFTADAAVETPSGAAGGHDAIVEQARARHAAPKGLQHMITIVLVDQQGDSAQARANLLAVFATEGPRDPAPFMLGEVYRFQLRRSPDGWRFTRMSTAPSWTLNAPAALAARL
jgi:hypothetical protein